jgi:AcrR family transcriptional regulator
MSAEDRRRQLVEFGTELLVSEPLDNLTGQRLAEMAGVSRGLVFHYFPTVRDLHLACLAEAARNLVTQLEMAAEQATADHDDVLERCLRVFVGYIAQTPRTFLTMSGYAITDPDFGEIFDKARVQILRVVLGLVDLDDSRYAMAIVAGWTAFVERTVLEWMRQAAEHEQAQVDEKLLAAMVATLDHLAMWLVQNGHATLDVRADDSSTETLTETSTAT